MKLCFKASVVATLVAISFSVIGCSGPAGFSYKNVAVTLTPMCEDCPNGIIYNPAYPMPSVVTKSSSPGAPGAPSPAGSVLLQPNAGPGGVFWFQANVTNAPANLTWALYPTPDLGDITVLPSNSTTPVGGTAGNVFYSYGTITSASGNVAYFSQSGIPTYTGGPALQQALAMGIPQGDVLITATVPSDPNNPSTVTTASQVIQMFNPSGNPSIQMFPRTPTNPAGLTTSVATIPRGTSFQFTGYAVGDAPCASTTACNAIAPNTPLNTTDNTVVWLVGDAHDGVGTATVGGMVNGVPGPYGTITQNGLYTAPPVIPISGYNPLIILEAHAAATVQGLAYVTVN